MENYSLIVPMLNASKKYENSVPIEFQYDNKTGELNCIKSICGINLSLFTDVYFAILKVHNDKYDIVNKIQLAIENTILRYVNYHFILFDDITGSQAETIYTIIKDNDITGSIFIKDADNMCICDKEIKTNTVLVYPLENTPIVDPQHKSYVAIDDQNFVTNIIEKKVVSNLFNCGGYSFNSADDFILAYDAVKEYESKDNHMYISHIIYWLILNKKLKFRPVEATEYEDFEIKLNN